MKHTHLGGLTIAIALSLLAPVAARAIDPLPPELENASLEKKAAYWQKTSREGGELRHQVAMKRWEEGQARKREALAVQEERAAAVKSELAAQSAVAEGKVVDPTAGGGGSESSILLYVMLGGMLAGGGYLMHQKLQEAEQTS